MANEFKLSYTAADINTRLGRIDSLAEKSELPKKLSDLTNDSDFATKDYVQNNAQPIGDYALKSDIPTDYLTEIPSEYVTETELNAKGYLTEHQSLEGLATQEYVEESLAQKQPIGDYALKSDIPTGGSAIIDVVELPTEDIRQDVFYRQLTAKFVSNQDKVSTSWNCYCVENLPEVGDVCTDIDMNFITAYYNISDNNAYGYVDETLGENLGIPAGWYPVGPLFEIAEIPYLGTITDISDDPCDGAVRILLGHDFYIYQDGWCKIPFACEKEPEFDIQWDGVIGDRVALDMSLLGYDQGVYFVKVSDDVFTTEELIDWEFRERYDGGIYESTIEEHMFDTTTYPGAFTIDSYIVVIHSQDELATALGLPTGFLTNGVYFLLTEYGYVYRLVSPPKVVKIDEKYLPDMSVDVGSLGLHSVATSGNYNDLYNKPNLNNYVTSSQVQTMITNAIGTAIGGSY